MNYVFKLRNRVTLRTNTVWIEAYLNPIYWSLKERFLATVKYTWDSTYVCVLQFFYPKKSENLQIFAFVIKFVFLFFMSFLSVWFLCELQLTKIISIFFNIESIIRKGYLLFKKCQCIPEFILDVFLSLKFIFLDKVIVTFSLKGVSSVAWLDVLGLKKP